MDFEIKPMDYTVGVTLLTDVIQDASEPEQVLAYLFWCSMF